MSFDGRDRVIVEEKLNEALLNTASSLASNDVGIRLQKAKTLKALAEARESLTRQGIFR